MLFNIFPKPIEKYIFFPPKGSASVSVSRILIIGTEQEEKVKDVRHTLNKEKAQFFKEKN